MAIRLYNTVDYIVNLDMSIPFALARPMLLSTIEESQRRTGLPRFERGNILVPLVFARPRRIKGKER